MKRLNELYDTHHDVLIKGIKINSKEVEPGDIFVCTKGVTADRHDFIEDAISKGAAAIVVSKEVDFNIPNIMVNDTNKELPLLASRFYDYPEKMLDIIGITGTNGKTTVASIISDLLGNETCGYMGTNGYSCSKFKKDMLNTSPDADRLYMYFRELVDSGCKTLAMETSSEGFYWNRFDNLEFKVGIITNITKDHMNVHKTLENYVACKQKLITSIKEDGCLILNTDDFHYENCLALAKVKVLTYGKADKADLKIIKSVNYIDKTNITLRYQEKEYNFDSPLIGEFNVYNLCAAMLCLISFGLSIEEIINRVSRIKKVSGRAEILDFNTEYKIMLDYAHTPDAFAKLFTFLNSVKKGRLITVTGSAGGREQEKRAPMGNIVLDNSDYVIFTMDDPRHEDVNAIIDDMVSLSEKNNYERIIDRKEAIYKAFSMAGPDDIVLVAGKAVDNYMAVGDDYLEYNDLEVIRDYFR